MPHDPVTAMLTREPVGLTIGAAVDPVSRPTAPSLKVVCLASYPAEAAATRHRVLQFEKPLADQGIAIDFRPFLTRQQFVELYDRRHIIRTAMNLVASLVSRCRDLFAASRADVIFVQREAMLFGPPVIEFILARVLRKPLVLDLDDPTYVAYMSPTYGRIAAFVKCSRKTDDLIRWSRVVICGNRSIADHVAELGTRAVVIPTVVDTERFRPPARDQLSDLPVLGWIGSHSTFRYLESVLPALSRLAKSVRFRLLIVGSSRDHVSVPGVEVVCRPWSLSREIADFSEIDIGLYPLIEERWAAGKSGFKAIQYMSIGIPYVVSPVGACADIGEEGTTHLSASTPDEWHDALAMLLGDDVLRRRMGAAGRRHVLSRYSVTRQADKLASAFMMAAAKGHR